MSSGRRVIQYNNLERALSTDLNRAQAFQARDDAEAYRYLLDTISDEADPGFFVQPTTVTGNSGAEIFGGLMVKPQLTSLSLFVDPGVVYMMAPDSGADDSSYKFINDVGVSTVGTLVMTANASGSTRIDVIECRPNPIPVVVTDSRDIYDPVTELFAPAVVTKEMAFQLEYRVRAGTPGAGFPGLVPGWLVLAVASVPAGTTTNDTITFWDVRALVSDRDFSPANVGSLGEPRLDRLDMKIDRVSAASALVTGIWKASLNGRRLGGEFRRGTPGADVASIDVANIANQDSAITEALTGNVFLYACTPFQLPRWARYTDAPSTRLPRTTKGLLVASYTMPDFLGNPSVQIALPASTGFVGATTGDAVCVAICPRSFSGSFWAEGFATNKIFKAKQSLTQNDASLVGTDYDWSITDAMWPPNVKAVYIRVITAGTGFFVATMGVASFFPTLLSYEDATTGNVHSTEDMATANLSNPTGGTLQYTHVWTHIRVPTPVRYPASPISPRLLRIDMSKIDVAGINSVSTAMRMNIEGFEL